MFLSFSLLSSGVCAFAPTALVLSDTIGVCFVVVAGNPYWRFSVLGGVCQGGRGFVWAGCACVSSPVCFAVRSSSSSAPAFLSVCVSVGACFSVR